jgi:hypothetical protein
MIVNFLGEKKVVGREKAKTTGKRKESPSCTSG